MKSLLLLGAGHAQLSVLGAFAQQRLVGGQVLLVTPSPVMLYSGMVPGLVAGRFTEGECSIDIAAWAQAAGVHVRQGRAASIDAAARQVTLADGEQVSYDVLSLDTGAPPSRERIPGAREHALFVRPLEDFAALWPATRALGEERPLAVVIIGSGAAGVELALAVRASLGPRASVAIVADEGVLPSYAPGVQRRANAALRRAKVQLLPGRCTAVEAHHVVVGETMRVACDVPIVVTGAEPPAWLATSGLALDERGFVRTGATLQSTSHPNVFAAGDVASREDAPHPKSGVYAVRSGPVLAANLRAYIAGGSLSPYVPQPRSLNLLATGDGGAIASWGSWSFGGRVMGWWKDRIDRAHIARWQRVAEG